MIEAVAAARSGPARSLPPAMTASWPRPSRPGSSRRSSHLVQNAIDASPAGEPVELRCFESGGDVAIEIVDRGAGMSEDFIRTRLFQPFVSTKENGFGIGAYEARALIDGDGRPARGRERVGEGTRFTIFLPGRETRSALPYERMRA